MKVKKVCKAIIDNLHVERKNWTNPYMLKVEGFVYPLKLWRFGTLNQDKIIYFITDVTSKRAGTFAIYLVILNDLSYAKAMNWIPIIDDTPGLLRRLAIKGKKGGNFINDIFDIQNDIPVSEVLKSQNVMFCNTARRINMMRVTNKMDESYKIRLKNFFDVDEKELAYWREFAHNNLRFKKDIQEELDNAYGTVIQGKKDILAVAVREGKMSLDEKTRKRAGEQRQPSLNEIIRICKRCFKKWNCSYIYLSCEAPETISKFQEIFSKENVLFLDRYRFSMKELKKIKSFKSGDKFYNSTSNIDNYELDYIKEMYILSKSDYLISAINCGVEAAYIMSSGFKDQYIIRK
ncbi:hypothetical protein [Parablautia muri]|uniref:Uncharacterized protein n=1 Tax=Parablautia muri TaxID=2320879 RepID=A0A9X5GT24_9FIRM|nr:hypothetical protein [Parablautia muri]NBJ92532.1 hypothetical protein [Parablautia muri]